MKSNHSRTYVSAFSLVEVALAVGLLAFALLALLGMLAGGLHEYRGAMNTTICAQIAQRVINDAQQSDFDVLIDAPAFAAHRDKPGFTFRAPRIAAGAFRYFDEQGNEIVPGDNGPTATDREKIIYDVNVRIRPRAELPRGEAAIETELAQVTLQIAHNPSGRDLPIEEQEGARKHLFRARAGIPIYTYSALVGRNQ